MLEKFPAVRETQGYAIGDGGHSLRESDMAGWTLPTGRLQLSVLTVSLCWTPHRALMLLQKGIRTSRSLTRSPQPEWSLHRLLHYRLFKGVGMSLDHSFQRAPKLATLTRHAAFTHLVKDGSSMTITLLLEFIAKKSRRTSCSALQNSCVPRGRPSTPTFSSMCIQVLLRRHGGDF